MGLNRWHPFSDQLLQLYVGTVVGFRLKCRQHREVSADLRHHVNLIEVDRLNRL